MPVSYSSHSAGPMTRRVVLGPEQMKDLAYYEMTKAELQAAAKARGLSTSGTKDALIQRLQETD